MQLKNEEQSERDVFADRVWAAMATGNHSNARTMLRELREVDEQFSNDLRADVIAEYGVSL